MRRLPILSLLSANLVSELGNTLAAIAIPWYVLETTGSAARAGVVGAANMLAMFLAGLLGGVVVDRLSFKRTSIVADFASGLSVAGIPLLAVLLSLQFWQLLLLVFVGALLDNAGRTARHSLVPDLAQLAAMPLERANAFSRSALSLSTLLGPVLAGLLIATLGAQHVLWLDALSFAISAALVAGLVPGRQLPALPALAASGSFFRAYLADLAEGWAFVRRERLVRAIIVNSVVTNFAAAPLGAVIFPIYGREVLGSAATLGVVLAAYGAGALLGSLAFGAVGHRLPRHPIYTVSFFCMGVPLILLALEPPFVLGVALFTVSGLGYAPLNPIGTTISQERVPADLRGRVFGLGGALAVASAPLGMLTVGLLVDASGVTAGLAVVAVIFFAMTVNLALNPAFREMNLPLPSATIQAYRVGQQ